VEVGAVQLRPTLDVVTLATTKFVGVIDSVVAETVLSAEI